MQKHLPLALGVAILPAVQALAQITLPGFPNPVPKDQAIEKTQTISVSNFKPMAPHWYTIEEGVPTEKATRVIEVNETVKNTENDEVYSRNKTYEYDDYGVVSKEHYTNPWGEETFEYNYEWEVPGKVWKEATQIINGVTHVQKRTFHDNGMVATEKLYDAEGNLTREVEISPEGQVLLSADYDNGKLTHIYLLDFNGEFNQAPAVDIEYDKDQKCLTRRVYWNDTEPRQLDMIQKIWAANQNIYTQYFEYYESDGTLNRIMGSPCTLDGDIFTIKRVGLSRDKEIVEYGKDEISTYFEGPQVYDPEQVAVYKTFAKNADDEFVLQRSITKSWVAPRFQKIVESYSDQGDYVYYGYFTEGNNRIGQNAYFDEETGNYCLLTSSEPSTFEAKIGCPWAYWNSVYTHYDKDGNELYSLKSHDRYYWSKQEAGSTEWTPCTGTMTMQLNSSFPREMVFDSENRLTSYSFDSGVEKVKYLYNYTENGYTEEYWAKRNGDDDYVKGNITTTENTQDTFAQSNLFYNPNSDSWYGYKNTYYFSTHLMLRQNYIEGNWEGNWYDTFSSYEELPDKNLYARIDYQKTSEDAAIPAYKYVRCFGYSKYLNYNEEYYWDTENNEWVGQSKSYETNPEITEFWAKQSTNGYEATMQPNGHASNETWYVLLKREKVEYAWDTTAKDWTETYSDKVTPEILDNGKTGKQTQKFTRSYGTDTSENFYYVDDEGYIICRNTIYNGDKIYEHKYFYNDDYNLIQETDVNGIWFTDTRYTYAEIEIISGVSENDAVKEPVEVNNRTLTCNADATVYNLQGMTIAKIAAGASTTLPASGIYLVRTATTTHKVNVK